MNRKLIITKKFIATMLLFITVLGIINPVFAISGNGNFVAAQFDSKIKTTDNASGSTGIIIRRLTNNTTGERMTVFCAERGVDFDTGVVSNGDYCTPSDPNIKAACKIAYFGWYEKHGYTVVDGGLLNNEPDMVNAKMEYVFTQQYIWEVLGQSNATFIDSNIQNQYVAFKENINQKIADIQKLPSFDDTTIQLEAGETKIITDNNNVLQDYNSIDVTHNEIRFQHNKGENTLTISVSENCTTDRLNISDDTMKSWGMIKEKTQDNDTTIYFTFNNGFQSQLYAMHYNDPVTMKLSLSINLSGNIELTKTNTNGELIDGSIFTVTGPNGFYQDVTVTNGKITIEKLKSGTYTIKEKSAPYGYLLNPQSYSVEVKANQTSTQAIVNEEPTGTFTLTKYNADKSAKITGIKYHIWSDNGYDEIHTTDDNGKIEITNLKLGIYNYQEIETVAGYLIDDTQYSFSLDYANQDTAVVFSNAEQTNDEPTGEITIEKTDKLTGNKNRIDQKSHHGDATLSGATYTLYAKEDIYNVARTVKYFSKDEQIATFTFNEYGVASIKITNTSTSAKLSIKENTLCGLPMGIYYSKETIVPIGYNEDTTIYEYTLSYQNDKASIIKTSGTVINDVKTAPFEVIKVSTNTNTTAELVSDAEFTAILSKYVEFYGSFDEALKHLDDYASDEYSIFRTGSNGHGISGRLAYGEYTVRETYTPSPEINTVEDFYVTIDRDSNTSVRELVENDSPFEAYLLLQKKDKASGEYVTYSNATFSLYKLNEDNEQWEKVQCKVKNEYVDSWTTDDNGMARTETKLEAGTYKLDEIKIPTGFLQLDEELIFKVDNRNSTLNYDEDWDAWITVSAVNNQPKGKLEVNKTVNLQSDVDKTLIQDIDYTKIAFELIANERIIDYTNGSTIYEKGQTVGKYNLDAEGKLVVDNLWMGAYYLKEISNIDGTVLDETKYDVVFTQTDTSTKEYTVKLDIGNNTTLVEFSKTDITGETELKGAELSVLDLQGNLIDSWTSSEKTHKIEGLKVGNTYVLHEESTPDGYVKATDIEFTVENTAEIQKVQMIDKIVEMYKKNFNGEELEGAKIQIFDADNNLIDEWISEKTSHRINGLEEGKKYRMHEEIALDGYVKATDIEFTVTTDKETQTIEMIDKVVEMTKNDIGGEEIEGAEMTVIDENNETVDSWTSTKEPHKISGLEEGKTYTLHEEIAPDGYVKATDIEFTVTTDKETQTIEMIDKVVDITKTDLVNGEEIEGAELVVTDESGNIIDEWTSTKEPHHVKNLEENKTYILTETTAPYGYEIAESIEFTVSTDKEKQFIEMKDKPILKNVQVEKIDSSTDKPIKFSEFEFGIYEDESCTKLIKTATSNESEGTVLFEELRYGTYYIKEIKEPLGYSLSEQIVKIEINDKGVFADGITLDEKDSIYSFMYYNSPLPKIQTGNEMNYTLLSILMGLSLIGITTGIVILKRKNKKDK